MNELTCKMDNTGKGQGNRFFPDESLSYEINGILSGMNSSEIAERVHDFFLKDMKKYLAALDTVIQEVAENNLSPQDASATFDKLTNEILDKGNILEAIINNNSVLKKIKQLFRDCVGDRIYRGEIVRRAYEKPRGYPGDYRMIETIYNNSPLSDNDKDLAFYSDKYFLNSEYAVSVRNRENMMKELLQEFIVTNKNASPMRILNLACGSCREIRELLENKNVLKERLYFACIDQDEEALEFSGSLLKGKIESAEFDFRKENILDFIRDDSLYDAMGEYNLIYSIGLIDYLPDVALKIFISFCFHLLGPKGVLILTHKDIDVYKPLAPNWFCDWNFYSRNEDSFLRLLGSSGISGFDMEIKREESQRIFFISIKKR